jgi:uroporphyrin-III C-methyltransferase
MHSNSIADALTRLRARDHEDQAGMVYLVGAGPGDPELLTLRAARLLAQGDIVVYDHLVSHEVLELAGTHAELIYVGKERNNHTLPQEEINALLVRLSRYGKQVVRLKGGDPYIFGRGGEEAAALAEAGIPFEVVPGITAAVGASASAGIPLTHRDFAQACVFVTGHGRNGVLTVDWVALAQPRQTVVFYMGLGALGDICSKLIAHGLDAGTPAALIERATLPDQRVIEGTLRTLPSLQRALAVDAPCLVVVGEVVKLRKKLEVVDRACSHTPSSPVSVT